MTRGSQSIPCLSQRLLENKGYMDLTCGSPGNIITGVDFAAWGVADTQPEWDFSEQPGKEAVQVEHIRLTLG